MTISHTGYIKRSPSTLYRAQRRGGKGKTGMKTKEEDFVEHLFIASTKDYILFFTDAGKVYWLRSTKSPRGAGHPRQGDRQSVESCRRGRRYPPYFPVKGFTEDRIMMMATRLGVVKKTPHLEYSQSAGSAASSRSIWMKGQTDYRGPHRRQEDVLLGFEKRQVDPFPGGRWPTHGTGVTRGAGDDPEKDDDVVIGMEIVNEHDRVHPIYRNGKRFRQTDRTFRVSPPVARRQRCHHHQDHGEERLRRWYQAGNRRK